MAEEEVLHEARKTLDLAYPEQVFATAFSGNTKMQMNNSCNTGGKESEELTPNSK